MDDSQLARLARMLDLSTRISPKLSPPHETPGLARLDHYSGLFLIRGAVEGEWMLEARSWGQPTAQSVHEWHVLAAGAAHQLDPTVILPERMVVRSRQILDRPVGSVANKRWAPLRRRLVGIR
jgi:hypothetical protein